MGSNLLAAFTGFAGGILSGAALCAFYIALGLYSKLQQICGYEKAHIYLTVCNLAGVVFGTLIGIFDAALPMQWILPVFGVFGGAFIGVYILSLAEVTSLLPKMYRIQKSNAVIVGLLMIFAAGKLAGSLVNFLHSAFL